MTLLALVEPLTGFGWHRLVLDVAADGTRQRRLENHGLHREYCDIDALANFVDRHPRLFVLTGAGVSTDSGIPGYRDADGQWTREPPIRIDEFLRTEEGRRRYWHRSMLGWPLLALARPNAAHAALSDLESFGHVTRLVTQNVDGLHQRAGSQSVIELHGNAHRATCLACGTAYSRAEIQRELERTLAVPVCDACSGILKPDVVFFGDCVPRDRVEVARTALERADAMLVVGSSLMVYSGYRFCEWAARMGKPIAAINLGRTRADSLLSLKVERPCADALSALVAYQQNAVHAAIARV
jgi:NAD-dependent SIR2 family protein deacetylase